MESTDNNYKNEKPPNRAQVAAARLLVKREREGKATIEVTDRVRRMAAYGDQRDDGTMSVVLSPGSAFIRRGKHLEETLAVHDAAHRGQQFQDYYDGDWNLVRRRYSDGTVLRVVDE